MNTAVMSLLKHKITQICSPIGPGKKADQFHDFPFGKFFLIWYIKWFSTKVKNRFESSGNYLSQLYFFFFLSTPKARMVLRKFDSSLRLHLRCCCSTWNIFILSLDSNFKINVSFLTNMEGERGETPCTPFFFTMKTAFGIFA